MAPAVTNDLFKSRLLPMIQSGLCPHPTMYLLSDVGERDDEVGPYGKSLLYLVSNSFEGQRETPLLGMERFVSARGPDKQWYNPELNNLFQQKVDGFPSLVIAGAAPSPEKGELTGNVSRSESHGGFDNDPDTLNSVLRRILGAVPKHPFSAADRRF